MAVLFWVCLALTLYVYLGYPLLLVSGLLGRRKPVRTKSNFPPVSILVPAYNEEKTIENKLQNLLAQDYPGERVEILVGNDGSTDHTETIVRKYQGQGVHLISVQERQGKSAIQNELATRSTGQVLVFTDADCLLPSNALRVLAENLADPEVSLVTNCVVFLNRDENGVVGSEGLYWRYERWLRQQESDRRLLAMASGSLFAIRRESWTPLDPRAGDDFVLPLQVVQRGYRNVQEHDVSAVTRLTQNHMHSMLQMKVRIISKDLRGLLQNRRCLNPLRVGAVAISLWSHKLLRWAVPYFLLGLLVSNVALASDRHYAAFLAVQILFYALALAGVFFGNHRFRFPISIASSFCLVNAAALLGTLRCLSRPTSGLWRTVR